jgi:hypothetical protein
MKKMITLLAVIAVLGIAGSAAAQDSWWQDQIGIYSSTNPLEAQPCAAPGPGYAHAYLVLRNMTCPNGLAAWECRLSIDGDGMITSVTHGNGIDADSDLLGYALGLETPLPYSDFLVLADIEYATFGGVANLYVHPNYTPSLPGVPVYVDGADPMHKIAMYIASQSEDEPCFIANGDCPVATATSTWGAVKDLYR